MHKISIHCCPINLSWPISSTISKKNNPNPWLMMSWYILMCRHNDAPPMYLYPGTSAHMSHVSQSWFITTGNSPPVTLSSILINVPEPQRLASTGPQLQTLRCILKSFILHWVHYIRPDKSSESWFISTLWSHYTVLSWILIYVQRL